MWFPRYRPIRYDPVAVGRVDELSSAGAKPVEA